MSDKLTKDPLDFLDDITDREAVADAFKRVPSKRANYSSKNTRPVANPVAEPGYVPCPDRGSYHARAVLKALGGYFDWDQKYWFVPVARREEAFAACAAAERANADLVAQEVASLLEATAAVVFGTCWECGGSLGEYPTNVTGQMWNGTTQRLKPGAIVEEAYCGCVERGDAKRRHRPDFRGSRFTRR